METTHAVSANSESLLALQTFGTDVVYLMGLSFVSGSLFTIFILLMLDFLRMRAARKNTDA